MLETLPLFPKTPLALPNTISSISLFFPGTHLVGHLLLIAGQDYDVLFFRCWWQLLGCLRQAGGLPPLLPILQVLLNLQPEHMLRPPLISLKSADTTSTRELAAIYHTA